MVATLGYFVLSGGTDDGSMRRLAAPPQLPASRDVPVSREKGARQVGSAFDHGWEAKGANPGNRASAAASRESAARESNPADSSSQSVERLLETKLADRSVTAERANEIRQALRALAQRGVEGEAAIEGLQRELGELDEPGGSGAGDERSSTVARHDPQTAPPENVRPLLERLAGTMDPMEIATLAQELEEAAPGVYRQELLDAARQALQRAAQDPPGERVDVSPLFEVFEAYGGERTAEQLAHETTWWTFSLMALAGMRDGQGIPSLIETASDSRVPLEQRPQLAFQMLAQAAAEYPEAGAALVDLARSGQIPERAWGALASALEGMHLRFPLQMFNDTNLGYDGSAASGAPRLGGFESENLDVGYDLRLVSPTWSEEQFDRQIDLIDQLIEATGSTKGKEALNGARTSLLGGR